MPSHRDVGVGVAMLSAVILLYSLIVVRQILLGTLVTLLLVVTYLGWRFVRAHERIADAMEVDATGADADGSPVHDQFDG